MAIEENIKILAINRHRMQTDGHGITTLVALPGCPLSCRYCLNRRLLEGKERVEEMPIERLAEKLFIDHCYFVYTGGGVTFGGGEPLLQSREIAAFGSVCPKEWRITIETSLNVPGDLLTPVLVKNFSFIIDMKTLDPAIYEAYTGGKNEWAVSNLKQIVQNIPPDRFVVKVPHIPDFTESADVEKAVEGLQEIGIARENIIVFHYLKQTHG